MAIPFNALWPLPFSVGSALAELPPTKPARPFARRARNLQLAGRTGYRDAGQHRPP